MFKWKKWNNPDLVEKVKKTKEESFFNIRGSVANHIMWDLENQELITMCEYLEKFYGLMIYRKDFEGRLDDLFEGCINEIRNAIGVYLKILEKPMKKQFEIDLERKEMKELKKSNKKTYCASQKPRRNKFLSRKKIWERLSKIGKDGKVKSIDVKFDFRFMQSSLAKLASNLLRNDFRCLKRYINYTDMMTKGVFPYDCFDSIEKMKDTKLRPKEELFSRLCN